MPSTDDTAWAIGWVTKPCISSAGAPGYSVVTQRQQPQQQDQGADHQRQHRPAHEQVGKCHGVFSLGSGAAGRSLQGVYGGLHGGAVAQAQLPGHHHLVVFAQALLDHYPAGLAFTGTHRHTLYHQGIGGGIVAGDEHRVAVGGVGHGGFRHGQHLAVIGAGYLHAGIHAGRQARIGLCQGGLHLHRARTADQGIDGGDMRGEGRIGERIQAHLDRLAGAQLGAELLLEGEVDIKAAGVDQADHRVADIEILALVHPADTQAPVEGCAHRLLGDHRLGTGQLALGHVAGRQGVVQLFLGGGVLAQQVLDPPVVGPCIVQLGLQAQALGLLRGIVEGDQHITLAHLLAGAEVDRRHPPADLGRHQHLVHRLQLADAGEGALLRCFLYRGQGHLDQVPRRGCRGLGLPGVAPGQATGGPIQVEQEERQGRPQHQHQVGELQAFLAYPVAEPQAPEQHGEGEGKEGAKRQVQPGAGHERVLHDDQPIGADPGRQAGDDLQQQDHHQRGTGQARRMTGPAQQGEFDGRRLAQWRHGQGGANGADGAGESLQVVQYRDAQPQRQAHGLDGLEQPQGGAALTAPAEGVVHACPGTRVRASRKRWVLASASTRPTTATPPPTRPICATPTWLLTMLPSNAPPPIPML
ncbi:hypothetical protein WR25_17778 [Diploscapter pachys]|uniref:Uncharacterized protein n=1 Tax=Diploscapter pachys TaxID=2018661 RepID=A0A2A2M2U5_9BILA|nr:hypothetical protein WR25_17778 [Diploscapter pachys]